MALRKSQRSVKPAAGTNKDEFVWEPLHPRKRSKGDSRKATSESLDQGVQPPSPLRLQAGDVQGTVAQVAAGVFVPFNTLRTPKHQQDGGVMQADDLHGDSHTGDNPQFQRLEPAPESLKHRFPAEAASDAQPASPLNPARPVVASSAPTRREMPSANDPPNPAWHAATPPGMLPGFSGPPPTLPGMVPAPVGSGAGVQAVPPGVQGSAATPTWGISEGRSGSPGLGSVGREEAPPPDGATSGAEAGAAAGRRPDSPKSKRSGAASRRRVHASTPYVTHAELEVWRAYLLKEVRTLMDSYIRNILQHTYYGIPAAAAAAASMAPGAGPVTATTAASTMAAYYSALYHQQAQGAAQENRPQPTVTVAPDSGPSAADDAESPHPRDSDGPHAKGRSAGGDSAGGDSAGDRDSKAEMSTRGPAAEEHRPETYASAMAYGAAVQAEAKKSAKRVPPSGEQPSPKRAGTVAQRRADKEQRALEAMARIGMTQTPQGHYVLPQHTSGSAGSASPAMESTGNLHFAQQPYDADSGHNSDSDENGLASQPLGGQPLWSV